MENRTITLKDKVFYITLTLSLVLLTSLLLYKSCSKNETENET